MNNKLELSFSELLEGTLLSEAVKTLLPDQLQVLVTNSWDLQSTKKMVNNKQIAKQTIQTENGPLDLLGTIILPVHDNSALQLEGFTFNQQKIPAKKRFPSLISEDGNLVELTPIQMLVAQQNAAIIQEAEEEKQSFIDDVLKKSVPVDIQEDSIFEDDDIVFEEDVFEEGFDLPFGFFAEMDTESQTDDVADKIKKSLKPSFQPYLNLLPKQWTEEELQTIQSAEAALALVNQFNYNMERILIANMKRKNEEKIIFVNKPYKKLFINNDKLYVRMSGRYFAEQFSDSSASYLTDHARMLIFQEVMQHLE